MHATSVPLSLYLSTSSSPSSSSPAPSSHLMDSAFLLDGDARSNLLHLIAQSFGCRYICLWSYLSPNSCLCYLDGLFEEAAIGGNGNNIQPRRLFDEYRQSLFILRQNSSHTQVPGLAFRNSSPYLEFREEDLSRLASNSCQRQFYQEASIKVAVFMGCRSGEIELGFSNIPQVDLEMQMMNLFPEDFSRQIAMRELAQATEPNTTAMTNPPSSSSSSLRSLSMDSPEYSSLLFSIPTTTTSSFINPELALRDPPIVENITTQPLPLITTTDTPGSSTTGTSPHPLQAMQGFARSLGNIQFPIVPESEHAAMTRAFLAVLSSPSSSTSSSQLQQQQMNVENPRPTAFRRYTPALLPRPQSKHGLQKHSMLKRAISYCRSMNLLRIRDRLQGGSRPPSTTQLHHMMSERKRREKLNESFVALRSLLPPGTKKDKASLLATTREYLGSLKEQVEDLRRKNAILEAQLLPPTEPTGGGGEPSGPPSDRSRVDVRTRTVSESTSQDRTVDLQVTVRGDCSALNLVIRILEFLRQVRNVSLMSMESDTQVHESNIVNRVNLRLNVEGGEWDEAGFQEAVRRVVADLAQ
ncbi:putative transcription factor bHLH041 [Syzygium oleosum]|uniref:putative transcription factor bHLH041 n=1 Tax=Syzygium oleosum TaxID=219896 RepID=UPI0011D2BC21|nr:putative transcription factor bHLH041 [Syzygium oleosum]